MSEMLAWSQFDIGSANPGSIMADWADWVPDAIESGVLDGFWFMQKPPGLRLRVSGDLALVEGKLTATDATFHQRGYCEEMFLFDGPAGMRAAHDFFTLDSIAIIRIARALSQRAAIDPEAASITLLDHLVCAAPLDPWERWDIWMRTLVLRGGDWQTVTPICEPGPQPVPPGDDYIAGIHRLFDGIEGEGEAIVFPNGIRAILPFWIVFHWNRMGFDTATQCGLASRQAARHHPRERIEAVAGAWFPG